MLAKWEKYNFQFYYILRKGEDNDQLCVISNIDKYQGQNKVCAVISFRNIIDKKQNENIHWRFLNGISNKSFKFVLLRKGQKYWLTLSYFIYQYHKR